MELFDTLASVGLTTRVLQIGIVAAIIIVIAGIFWQYILVGAGIVFCVAVFAMPTKSDSKPVEVKTLPTPEYKIEPMPLDPPEVKVPPEAKVQSDEAMFLEDCNLHSGYTQAQCKALWESDKAEIQKSNWKYKNNKAYIKKVKYGA
jgi:cell division protein FtsW (lipid II flippase)